MTADDVLALLQRHFTVTRLGETREGLLEMDFATPLEVIALCEEDRLVRLIHPLGVASPLAEDALRGFLQACLQGVETGMGQIALHPVHGPALVELVELSADMTVEDFQRRFVDFSLHAEYWQAEGVDCILDRVNGTSPTLSLPPETMIFRM